MFVKSDRVPGGKIGNYFTILFEGRIPIGTMLLRSGYVSVQWMTLSGHDFELSVAFDHVLPHIFADDYVQHIEEEKIIRVLL